MPEIPTEYPVTMHGDGIGKYLVHNATDFVNAVFSLGHHHEPAPRATPAAAPVAPAAQPTTPPAPVAPAATSNPTVKKEG